MKNARLAILSLLVVSSMVGYAQTEFPKLTKEDVNKFITTYKPLTEEFEKLGEEIGNAQDMTAMQALSTNSKAMSILSKYGWDESFSTKWISVAMTYSLVKMDQQLMEMPEAQREQYKAMLSAQLNAQQTQFQVTDDAKELIKARLSELDNLFEN